MKERKIPLIIFIAGILFFICIGNISAAGNKDKYIEKAGGFSIAVPERWEAVTVKGLKYKVLRGPFVNNFSPTINFNDENFDGRFDDYMKTVNKKLNDLYGKNVEYILQSDFVTSKGLAGRLIVITTFQNETLIQQSFFCFPSKDNRILLITCTNLANEFDKYNKLFNDTVKTFEWIK